VSYVKYNPVVPSRLQALPALYCIPQTTYCTNDIVLLVSGRLQSYMDDTPGGSSCPSNPVKYDSTGRKLYKSTETATCIAGGAYGVAGCSE
jgi:hypothetical protein